MKVSERKDLTPREFIRRLFTETENGKVSIEYCCFPTEYYTLEYPVDWTAEDAEQLVQQYDRLTGALERIGQLGQELEDPARREELLPPEDLEVWNTYIRPFTPFDKDEDEVFTLYFRRGTETLTDQENDLIQRHYDWFVHNSHQRLPFKRCPPAFVINRAQRYAELVRVHAPETVLQEEGRNLAEEMILYSFGPEKLLEYKE